ncbi:calcium-transporting ATPase, plasma membrane-type [Salix suchowensis]|nr:calcium-transporting ATPase, plasma membrane-type [Salix suchowensis]
MVWIERLLVVPATLSKPSKRWRLAFATIYCSRTIFLLAKIPISQLKIKACQYSFLTLMPLEPTKMVGSMAVLRTLLADSKHSVPARIRNRQQRDFSIVVEAFKDLTIAILLGCAAPFSLVFFLSLFSAISNYRQNRQFDKLLKSNSNIKIDVVRSGRRQEVSIFELVVPADELFIDEHSLQIDESSMTGESDDVEINHNKNPFLVSGTKVADGYGQMLVTSVGMNTTWGEMMCHISRETDEQTPLQARLNKLTSSIGKVGLTVSFLVLVVLMSGNKEFDGSKTKADDIVNAVVGIVAAAVTIIVAVIAEGLPLAVTLTLAYSMKIMMKYQAMVRKFSACETISSATTICTNITGILTMNLMKVTKFWLGQESMEQFLDALNTTSSTYRESPESKFELSGSPTEKAILSWAIHELNLDMEQMKHSCTILYVEAFNSQKKRSGVLSRKRVDNTIHVHCFCDYYDASGLMKDMDVKERNTFKQIIQGMAANSLRSIAFAHKQLSEEQYEDGKEEKGLKEDSLTLLGIVGIKDPCRPGVKKVVDDCQHAGVNIKMISGDNVLTARAITNECGKLNPGVENINGAVVEGEEFRNYIHEQRTENVDKICVMAKYSPFDKLLMVQCLKQKGHMVAVTVPLIAIQLLWVNLIMDTLGALLMKKKKTVGSTEPLISNIMWRNLLSQALVNDTLIFNIFALCQVFNEFNARKLDEKNVFKGIHKNRLFLGIIGITILLQVLMVQFLKKFADTEKFNWGQWGACIGIAELSWPIGWVVKYMPVPEKPIFIHLTWKK